MTQTIPETLLTVKEVAHFLRVDETTVRRWIRAGTLTAIELPHGTNRTAFRIRFSTIEKMIAIPSETR